MVIVGSPRPSSADGEAVPRSIEVAEYLQRVLEFYPSLEDMGFDGPTLVDNTGYYRDANKCAEAKALGIQALKGRFESKEWLREYRADPLQHLPREFLGCYLRKADQKPLLVRLLLDPGAATGAAARALIAQRHAAWKRLWNVDQQARDAGSINPPASDHQTSKNGWLYVRSDNSARDPSGYYRDSLVKGSGVPNSIVCWNGDCHVKIEFESASLDTALQALSRLPASPHKDLSRLAFSCGRSLFPTPPLTWVESFHSSWPTSARLELLALPEALGFPPPEIRRESDVGPFEMTIDLTWPSPELDKLLREDAYLLDALGLEPLPPGSLGLKPRADDPRILYGNTRLPANGLGVGVYHVDDMGKNRGSARLILGEGAKRKMLSLTWDRAPGVVTPEMCLRVLTPYATTDVLNWERGVVRTR